MVKVEPNSNSAASEPLRRSPRRSTSPQKPKRTIKIVKKSAKSSENGEKKEEKNSENGERSVKKGKKKSPKKEKNADAKLKQEPADPNAPLQMSLPTRAQKRRVLRYGRFILNSHKFSYFQEEYKSREGVGRCPGRAPTRKRTPGKAGEAASEHGKHLWERGFSFPENLVDLHLRESGHKYTRLKARKKLTAKRHNNFIN
jgi:hypothetical protein